MQVGPQVPISHSQFEINWEEDNPSGVLLSEENQCSSSSMWKNKQARRLEIVVGWRHSDPGYKCWLLGIDVSTQMLNKQFQDPFLAIVIDPTRTVMLE